MNKKKKTLADVGTVLHNIKDPATLKPWAEYMASVDPWKALEISADTLGGRWADAAQSWRFFSAADPKNAKTPGFEHEHGLIVFTAAGGRGIAEHHLKSALPADLGDGGYIQAIATKVRHKGVGKYLISAAERVISEKNARVYLFVSEFNQAAQRFYKNLGYEEIGRAADCYKTGNTEILLTRLLTP